MTETRQQEKSVDHQDATILAVVDRAREEVAWVRSAYKFAVSIIAILIAIGLYFSYNSIRDLKADLREDGKHVKEQLRTEIALLSRTLQQDFSNEVDKIRSEVAKRLDREFQQDNITGLVQAKAQERIDAVADKLIKDQVTALIDPLRESLTTLISNSSAAIEGRIHQLDTKIDQAKRSEDDLRKLLAEAQQTVAQVKQQSEFVLTVLAAQNDNRQSYDKLSVWAADDAYPLKAEAIRAILSIQLSYGGIFARERGFRTLDWLDVTEAENATFDAILATWTLIPADRARAFVIFVWNHTNITEEQKIDFLYGVLADSKGSLQAADEAARLLSEKARINYNPPFDFTPLKKWWDERTRINGVDQSAANNTSEDTRR